MFEFVSGFPQVLPEGEGCDCSAETDDEADGYCVGCEVDADETVEVKLHVDIVRVLVGQPDAEKGQDGGFQDHEAFDGAGREWFHARLGGRQVQYWS